MTNQGNKKRAKRPKRVTALDGNTIRLLSEPSLFRVQGPRQAGFPFEALEHRTGVVLSTNKSIEDGIDSGAADANRTKSGREVKRSKNEKSLASFFVFVSEV